MGHMIISIMDWAQNTDSGITRGLQTKCGLSECSPCFILTGHNYYYVILVKTIINPLICMYFAINSFVFAPVSGR